MNYGQRLKTQFWRSVKACHELGFYFNTEGFLYWVSDGGQQAESPFPPDVVCASLNTLPHLYCLFEVKVTECLYYMIPQREIQRMFSYSNQKESCIRISQVPNLPYNVERFVAVKFLIPNNPLWVVKQIHELSTSDVQVCVTDQTDIQIKQNPQLFAHYYKSILDLNNLENERDSTEWKDEPVEEIDSLCKKKREEIANLIQQFSRC